MCSAALPSRGEARIRAFGFLHPALDWRSGSRSRSQSRSSGSQIMFQQDLAQGPRCSGPRVLRPVPATSARLRLTGPRSSTGWQTGQVSAWLNRHRQVNQSRRGRTVTGELGRTRVETRLLEPADTPFPALSCAVFCVFRVFCACICPRTRFALPTRLRWSSGRVPVRSGGTFNPLQHTPCPRASA